MFCAPLRSETEKSGAVRAPHRPQLFRAARSDALIDWRRKVRAVHIALHPDFRFVKVAVAFAPPLTRSDAARRKRDGGIVRRGRGEEFVRVAIRAHRQRRPAFGADAKDVVHSGDVAARRREVEPAAVARPRVELIVRVVKRDAAQFARVEREHVDVAPPVRVEVKARRELGRIDGARFGGGVGDEQARFAAPRRDCPDVAAERDAISVRSGEMDGSAKYGTGFGANVCDADACGAVFVAALSFLVRAPSRRPGASVSAKEGRARAARSFPVECPFDPPASERFKSVYGRQLQ